MGNTGFCGFFNLVGDAEKRTMIAWRWFVAACKKYNVTVVAVSGVHIDYATKKDCNTDQCVIGKKEKEVLP